MRVNSPGFTFSYVGAYFKTKDFEGYVAGAECTEIKPRRRGIRVKATEQLGRKGGAA
jgi:hypothetical protein